MAIKFLNDINLGLNDIYAAKYWMYDGPNDNYGSMHFTDGNFHIEDADGHPLFVVEDGFLQIHKSPTIQSNLYTTDLTATRDHYLPNASGTIALTSQIPSVSGTTNYVSKFTGSTSLGNSQIFDNGTNVGIGTVSPATKFVVSNNGAEGMEFGYSGGISANYIQSINRSTFAPTDFALYLGELGASIKFYTETVERMRIASNGNVGIGTIVPQRKLEVKGSHTTSTFRVYYPDENVVGQDASVDIWASEPGISFNGSGIGSNVNGQPFYGRTNPALGQAFLRFINGNMMFHTSTGDAVYAERVRVDSSGNVGINTSSPSERFQVNGNIAIDSLELNVPKKIKFNANRNTFGTYGDIEWYNYQWDGLIKASIGAETSGALSNGTLIFKTSDGGSNASERMRILGNGNVGIGTSNPGFATAGRTVLTLNGPTSALMEFQNGGVFKSYLFQGPGGFEIYDISNIQFSVNGGERMRVASNGFIGIGTTAPIHPLSVVGRIGGNIFGDSHVEFLSNGNTSLKANNNVLIGYSQTTVVTQDGSVGVGTTVTETCAAVEIKSTTKGFLLPRMTDSEMNSIPNIVDGLMVWNLDLGYVFVVRGGGWKPLQYV